MKRIAKDTLSGLVLAVMAGLIGVGTLSIPVSSIGRYGARLVPTMVAVALGVLGILLIVDEMRKGRPEEAKEDTRVDPKERLPVRLTFLALAVYVIGIDPVGFPIMTFVYLVAQMYILSCFDAKRLPSFLLIALIGTAVIYHVFRSYFHVLLPQGIFG